MISKINALMRSDQNKTLLGNIGGTVVIKGFSVFVSLLATPAYISYFSDNVVLGVWYTLVAALNWILTFDFGVGNGLRNNLAIAIAKDDETRAKRLVSTAYISIGALTIATTAIASFVILDANWGTLLNYDGSSVSASYLRLSVLIVFVGTMLQFLLKLLTSVLFALQKTALNNLLFLIGNITVLLYLILVTPSNAGDALIGLSFTQVIAVNLPLLIGSIWFFTGPGKNFAPSIKFWDMNAVRDVLGLGSLFFVVQIAFLFINSTNEYLITLLYGSAPVVDYQVYYKCFYLIITVFTLAVQPIWSAMTVAIAEQRLSWVKRVYKIFNAGALLASAVAVILAAVFPGIVDLWLGSDAIETPTLANVMFALLVSITLFVNSSTCVANASNRMRPQFVFSIFGAALKVLLSVLFAFLSLPWYFVVLANCLALLPLLVAQVISNLKYFART